MVNIVQGSCYYCEKSCSSKTITRDHIVPKFRGGTNDPVNIVPACKSCNFKKGSLTLEAFYNSIQSSTAKKNIIKLIEYRDYHGSRLYRGCEIKEIAQTPAKKIKEQLTPIFDLLKSGIPPSLINTIDFHDYSD